MKQRKKGSRAGSVGKWMQYCHIAHNKPFYPLIFAQALSSKGTVMPGWNWKQWQWKIWVSGGGTRCITEPLWRLGLFLYQPNLAVAPRSHKFRAVSITEIAFVGAQPFSIWLEAILLVVSVSEDPVIRNTTEAWRIPSWGASTSKTWKWQGDGGGVSGL